MMAGKSFVFCFADIEVHEREFRLIKAGEVVPVEPKAFRVLLFLLHNPQRLIKKEELLDAVWGDTAVSENSLARSIGLLRRLLGDDIRDPRFIATVATVGYRFIALVEVLEKEPAAFESPEKPRSLGEQEASDSPGQPAPVFAGVQPLVPVVSEGKDNGKSWRWIVSWQWMVVSIAAMIVLVAAASWYLRRPLPPPRITEYNQITHDGRIKDLIGTDGSRLYFALVPTGGTAQVSVSGGEITQVPIEVPEAGVLAISPDGANFLLQSGPELNVWSDGVLGGSIRSMNGVFAQSAAYSADGKYLAYAAKHGDLIRVLSDGTKPQMLVPQATLVSSIDWSPDGSRIRFSESNKIWEVSSIGTNLHRLFSGQAGSDAHCCGHWTPDGKFFIFLSGTQPGGSGLFSQIWALDERRGVFRQPSSESIQLTSGPLR
jgi:DNA-binding winged helix-turn-helix (wHTH) protein